MFQLSLGQTEKAIDNLESALEIAKEVLGSTDEQVIITSKMAKNCNVKYPLEQVKSTRYNRTCLYNRFIINPLEQLEKPRNLYVLFTI